ncbi:major facilitator superfamily domain-containing protein, putative [Plasmodium vinckei vinckei]|uniref:Major facilitator superfamily domain-containing protein, putative n=1 Tax=Plasmodium vinckei vinckei TaxID=54757 RepID=A0A449BTR2_PLAVN|nr:major facilitator superfamily domain-containing protein, putative [Plasmodium vinckei vinckei]VEV56870.1 major facilitator superfamily domain-containing protein, putative [Plasmodium vinckei vinckei]
MEKTMEKKKYNLKQICSMINNLFPNTSLQYTYINTFILCLLFTFIHKYLDQTLPSLYKSIEKDFNIDIKILHYMNTIYRLAYSAFNFVFAIFFDFTFKQILSSKYDENRDSLSKSTNQNNNDGSNPIQYEVNFNNENEFKDVEKLSSDKKKDSETKCGNEKIFNSNKLYGNSFSLQDEITISEYEYTLKVLLISLIIYTTVILGIIIANNYMHVFFFLFIMGMNNSCIYILIQKIYTNNVFSENRSTIYGFLHFFTSISHMLSVFINTNLSNKLYFGYKGWRLCYFIIIFFPFFVSIFLLKLIKNHKLKKKGIKNQDTSFMTPLENLTNMDNQNAKQNIKRKNKNVSGNENGSNEEKNLLLTEIANPCSDNNNKNKSSENINDNQSISIFQKNGDANLMSKEEKKKEFIYEFAYLYEIKYVFKNYSFWIIIFMGMLNGIPKHVLSLMIYFFQYCNISDFKSGLIISISWLCASLVSPFIGIISDYIYKLNRDINRQLIGMCTHFIRITLMFIMFYFIPKEPESFIYFVIISLLMGMLSGWVNIGAHKPILIDIVKQKHTAFVISLMAAFENIGSSILGTILLNFFLNKYNYIDKRKINHVTPEINKHNVNVLSHVLLITTCFPWLISFCLLHILKYTYKKDKVYKNII